MNEERKWWQQDGLVKQLIDQGAHFGVALVLVGWLATDSVWWEGLLIGAFLGVLREISQHGRFVSVEAFKFGPGSRIDILFWTLGGLVGGFIG